ncbi:MAG: efflux RND transporter periplasmic adaptor subunit [Bacteroidia bacterium]
MKIIYAVICAAALQIVACNHKENEKKEAKFIATQPAKTDTTIHHDYVAQIRSIQHIELRAMEKGYIEKIYVDEGQYVRKGQLLFQIMPIIYQAETQKAKAEVSFAEIEYQNTKALAEQNVVSPNELAMAKAKLDKERAQLALAQAHLSFTEIRAPFDGIVGRFNDVRLGSLVDEGELLTTLSDNSKMWVYFNVPEAEYLDFATHAHPENKMRVQLQLANNNMFHEEGIIETIEADFNNETGNIAFRATFNNPKGILRNGETGNIFMPVTLKNALLIPQKATFEVLDKKFVYVIDEQNTVHATEIKIGSEMPHLYSVVSGLTASDKVLVEGLRKVKNGEQIKYELVPFHKIIAELLQLRAE